MAVELKTAGRQPRGWEQVVNQVNATTDAAGFHAHMLDLQCRVVAAQYGVLWARDEQGMRQVSIWPQKLSAGGLSTDLTEALSKAASGGFDSGLSQVMALHTEGQAPDAPSAQVFVTVMRRGGQAMVVSTVVAEVRDPQVIAATAPLREIAAGLYEGYYHRLEAATLAERNQHIQQAVALLAVMQEGNGFKGACMNLVNELAHQAGADHVSIGWVRGRSVKLTAVNDTDHVKRHSERAAQIEMAMAECLDQQQPIVYPLPDDAEPMLAEAVVYSHRNLLAGKPEQNVVSLPLRNRDDLVGVVTVERRDEAFDESTIQRLQMTADVIAPQLQDRFESDRWLIGHAWRTVRKGATHFVGARHVGWKLLGIACFCLLLYTLIGKWDYRVSAPFRFEAHNRKYVSAVYGGRLDLVHVEPGDKVTKDQVLAQLNSRELKLELIQTQSEHDLARLQRDHALTQGKQGEGAQASAHMRQLQARIDLLNEQIAATTIRSPVDGVVLAGYWHDKVGGAVKQGDAMFEIAPLSDLTAVMRVDEANVHRIVSMMDTDEPTLTGELATRAQPQKTFDIRLKRVVPMAQPVEGVNVFEVWCEIDDPAPWLRPGMEGNARLDVGREPIAWILTHRLIDAARLWLWW